MNTRKIVLVTGGAGYIGSYLIRQMALDPAYANSTIRILDNMQRGVYDGLLDLPRTATFEFVDADLMDDSAVARALHDVDTVVHLAAIVSTPFAFEHSKATTYVNRWGTARLLDARAASRSRAVRQGARASEPRARRPALPVCQQYQRVRPRRYIR